MRPSVSDREKIALAQRSDPSADGRREPERLLTVASHGAKSELLTRADGRAAQVSFWARKKRRPSGRVAAYRSECGPRARRRGRGRPCTVCKNAHSSTRAAQAVIAGRKSRERAYRFDRYLRSQPSGRERQICAARKVEGWDYGSTRSERARERRAAGS